jgi:hypothetical protein
MNDDKTEIPGSEMQANIDKVGVHVIKQITNGFVQSMKNKIKKIIKNESAKSN